MDRQFWERCNWRQVNCLPWGSQVVPRTPFLHEATPGAFCRKCLLSQARVMFAHVQAFGACMLAGSKVILAGKVTTTSSTTLLLAHVQSYKHICLAVCHWAIRFWLSKAFQDFLKGTRCKKKCIYIYINRTRPTLTGSIKICIDIIYLYLGFKGVKEDQKQVTNTFPNFRHFRFCHSDFTASHLKFYTDKRW